MNTNLVSSSSVFNFSAEHNGVQCIESLKPEDRGNARQYWFTAKMLATIFECSEDTIRRRIDTLVLTGDIVYPQICGYIKMPDSLGRMNKETVIYNLTVFNKIGMTFIDNPKAVEIRSKFNDVIIKAETKQNTLPAISKEDQFFLSIIHSESKADTALALNEYKKFRDEREQEIAFERDEAVRTKAHISSKREATLMGKVGGTTKALHVEREKNTKLLKENIDLIKEKEDLKIRLQASDTYKTIRQMTNRLKSYILTDTKSLQRLGKEMTKISMEMGLKVIKVPDDRYPEVNSYHTEVWRETFAKLNNDPLFLIDIRK